MTSGPVSESGGMDYGLASGVIADESGRDERFETIGEAILR